MKTVSRIIWSKIDNLGDWCRTRAQTVAEKVDYYNLIEETTGLHTVKQRPRIRLENTTVHTKDEWKDTKNLSPEKLRNT